jgi:hypothetical protein
MKKPLKLLKSKPDCILVQVKSTGIYKVVDIEGDTICMSTQLSYAEEKFNTYDISKIRAEREKVFRDWCNNVVEE